VDIANLENALSAAQFRGEFARGLGPELVNALITDVGIATAAVPERLREGLLSDPAPVPELERELVAVEQERYQWTRPTAFRRSRSS
jgi:hypothetical protein